MPKVTGTQGAKVQRDAKHLLGTREAPGGGKEER